MKWVFNLWPSLPRSHITLDPDQLLDILEIFLREISVTSDFEYCCGVVELAGRWGNTKANLSRKMCVSHQEEVRIFSELSKESTLGRYELKFLLHNLITQIFFPKSTDTKIEITSIIIWSSWSLDWNFCQNTNWSHRVHWKNADVGFGIDVSIFNPNSVRAAPYSKSGARSYPLRPSLDGNKTHIEKLYNTSGITNSGDLSRNLDPGKSNRKATIPYFYFFFFLAEVSEMITFKLLRNKA